MTDVAAVASVVVVAVAFAGVVAAAVASAAAVTDTLPVVADAVLW